MIFIASEVELTFKNEITGPNVSILIISIKGVTLERIVGVIYLSCLLPPRTILAPSAFAIKILFSTKSAAESEIRGPKLFSGILGSPILYMLLVFSIIIGKSLSIVDGSPSTYLIAV